MVKKKIKQQYGSLSLSFCQFQANNWAKPFPIAEFTNNNTRNASIGNTFFELICRYHFYFSYKENVNFFLKFKIEDELIRELHKLIMTYQ